MKEREGYARKNHRAAYIERKARILKMLQRASVAICLNAGFPPCLRVVDSSNLQKCTKLSGFSLKLYHKLSMTDPPAHQMLLHIILRELLGMGLSAFNSLFRGPSTCYAHFSVRPSVPHPLPPPLLTRHSGPCQFCRHSEVHSTLCVWPSRTISAPMISPFPIPLCPYHKHCDSNPLNFPQIC